MIINAYQCFLTLIIMEKKHYESRYEIERGLQHEKKHFARYHLHCFFFQTIANDLD